MEKLKEKLNQAISKLTFNELVELLNKTEIPEARGVILDKMETNYPMQFEKWL